MDSTKRRLEDDTDISKKARLKDSSDNDEANISNI